MILLCLIYPSMASAELASGLSPCNAYDECLKGFSAAVLSAESISHVAKQAFNNHWQVILDSKNMIALEAERVRDKSCDLESSLVFAPAGSPLGEIVRRHFKALEKSRAIKRDENFMFESDIKQIRETAKTGAYGMGIAILGAASPEEARHLLKAQNAWEVENSQDLAKYRAKTLHQFREACLEDERQNVKALRDKIMSEHRELNNLEGKLTEIQEECQNVYKYDLGTKNRYQDNKLSQSRYGRMKELAIAYCGPSDAIEYVLGKKNNCTQYIADVYDIVSPECEKRSTTAKGNLCNGLHRHLVKEFMGHPEYDEYLRAFVKKMNTSAKSQDKHDILDLALESTNGDHAAAMRLIAIVGHDEINTTMLTMREELMRTGQFDRLARAKDIYTKEVYVFADDKAYAAENGSDGVKGNMTLFKDLVRGGSPVGGKKLSGRYYHYVAGATVACELKLKKHGSFRAERGASLAGKIYEAFDFKSHISQGITFSASVDNFRRDTGKQDAGAALGASFCE